jgi:hypothetical protein
MLDLNINRRTLHLIVNNIIQPLGIINVRLPSCFLIISVGYIDEIEFECLLHTFDRSDDVNSIKKSENLK